MQRWRRQRGAALVESAMVIPILLLISAGVFEFGRAYQTWQVLTNAARETTGAFGEVSTEVGAAAARRVGRVVESDFLHRVLEDLRDDSRLDYRYQVLGVDLEYPVQSVGRDDDPTVDRQGPSREPGPTTPRGYGNAVVPRGS